MYIYIKFILLLLFYYFQKIKNIWSPADFVRLPTDKEMIYFYTLMVGLF